MKKLPPNNVVCPTCRGTGSIAMAAALQDVLQLFAANGQALTAREVNAALGSPVKVTAINNRLEELRKIGRLTRDKGKGHQWIYRVVKQRKHNEQ